MIGREQPSFHIIPSTHIQTLDTVKLYSTATDHVTEQGEAANQKEFQEKLHVKIFKQILTSR